MVEHGQFWVLAVGILEISKLKLYKKLAEQTMYPIYGQTGVINMPPPSPTYGHGSITYLPNSVGGINSRVKTIATPEKLNGWPLCNFS